MFSIHPVQSSICSSESILTNLNRFFSDIVLVPAVKKTPAEYVVNSSVYKSMVESTACVVQVSLKFVCLIVMDYGTSNIFSSLLRIPLALQQAWIQKLKGYGYKDSSEQEHDDEICGSSSEAVLLQHTAVAIAEFS